MKIQLQRIALIATSCLVFLTSMGPSTAHAQPSDTIFPQDQALVPSFRGQMDAALESELTRYTLDVRFDPVVSVIAGRVVIDFTNTTGRTLSDVGLRLYPNAEYYVEGGMSLLAVTVEGATVEPRFASMDTAALIDLPRELGPLGQTTIEIAFTTTIPADSTGSFGIFNHDSGDGTWLLADWYPIVAGWDESKGWRIETPTLAGDPTFSEMAFYDVQIACPSRLQVVSTGSTIDSQKQAGETIRRIVTGPAREFALALDDDLVSQKLQVGETTVTLYARSDAGTDASLALGQAADALETYAATYGPYPFRELNLVEADLALAFGVSWTGLVFLDSGRFLENQALNSGGSDLLAFTIFHEIGHQWWGSMVGADSNDHTFLIEGFTNAMAITALERSAGAVIAHKILRDMLVNPYLALLDAQGDQVVDVSVFDAPATLPLSVLSYGKGGLGFLAIRNDIGDRAFDQAVADYSETFRFWIAEPHDLLSAFETASGRDLNAIWNTWFEEAATGPAEVETLFAAITREDQTS